MKNILIASSFCFILLLSACSYTKKEITHTDLSIDTAGIYPKIFQLLYEENNINFPQFKKKHVDEWNVLNDVYRLRLLTNDEDTCEIAITIRIDEYMQLNKRSFSSNVVLQYDELKRLTEQLTPDWEEANDQIGCNTLASIAAIWEHYIYYHYRQKLSSTIIDSTLKNAIDKENTLWDNFFEKQKNVLDTLYEASAYSSQSMTYSSFYNEKYSRRLSSIIELYFAIQVNNYKPKEIFKAIADERIKQEYIALNKDIQTKKTNENFYTKEEQTQCLQNEAQAWFAWMDAREQVSYLLKGNVKHAYNNATYRLQKQHLIQLKNEFGHYGINSNQWTKAFLNENCSYEVLLKKERPRDIIESRRNE